VAKAKNKSLTIEDVCTLGSALIEIADLYPLTYRTERDFFPLVLAYLHGRVPCTQTEVGATNGKIDFRIGGPNPAVLELAVAPRALSDPDHPPQTFPGHKLTTQLYASQNRTELQKLKKIPQTKAKNRYLLLLDLRGAHDFVKLKAGYETQLPRFSGGSAVRAVYVKRNQTPAKHFVLGGKKSRRGTRQAASRAV